MAFSKRSASNTRGVGNTGDGSEHHPNGRVHTKTQDGENWLSVSIVAGEHVSDWLHQLQRMVLQSISTSNETFIRGLTELRKAEGPVQMLSAGSEGMTRLLDTLTAQQAGLMQLMFDSQLDLFGRLMKVIEAPEAVSQPVANGRDILSAWGKAQDEWLKTTQSVINSVNSVQAGH